MQDSINQDIQRDDSEISLADIVNFLADSWKKLVLAAVAGGALGLVGWFVLVPYSAQLPLINNAGLNVLSLKALQQTLPNLAAQIVQKKQAPQGQEAAFGAMSDLLWWGKNITPVFNLSKADIKELGPDFKLEDNPILFLMVDGYAKSRDDAIEHAKVASDFFRTGAIYLSIEDMLKSQEIELLNSRAEINKKYNSTLIELEYQQERLRGLENLAKRFPVDNRNISQVFDPKDLGAKYLPLSTQIIAINIEINANLELLKRLEDKKLYLGAVEQWITEARLIFTSSFNGIDLNKALLKLEQAQRTQAGLNNPRSILFFDEVHQSLLANAATYELGLVQSPAISVKKRGMIKSTGGGLAAAFFLMLMVLLGHKVWLNVKNGGVK